MKGFSHSFVGDNLYFPLHTHYNYGKKVIFLSSTCTGNPSILCRKFSIFWIHWFINIFPWWSFLLHIISAFIMGIFIVHWLSTNDLLNCVAWEASHSSVIYCRIMFVQMYWPCVAVVIRGEGGGWRHMCEYYNILARSGI